METLLDLPAEPHSNAFAGPTVSPVFSRRDASFVPGAVRTSVMVLELDAHYLRLAVADAPTDADSTHRVRLLEEFAMPGSGGDEPTLHDVRHLMSSHDVMTRNFWQSVRVLVSNQSFTLIPESLFRKEYAIRYLELARGTALTNERVYYTRHPEWQAVTVFSLPARLDDWLMSLYPFEKLQFFHQTDALIELGHDVLPPEGKAFLLYLETASVGMVYCEAGRLHYANRFVFRTISDLVYYVAFVLNELKIDPAEITVLAMGQFNANSEAYNELAKHLPGFALRHPSVGASLKDGFADIASHQYAALLRTFALA